MITDQHGHPLDQPDTPTNGMPTVEPSSQNIHCAQIPLTYIEVGCRVLRSLDIVWLTRVIPFLCGTQPITTHCAQAVMPINA
jgi:hypothetical protein